MTTPITNLLVELQMEMRQADPEKVKQAMVHNWMERFEQIADAYQRELVESGGDCDKLVYVKRDFKMTWVCMFLLCLSLV